MRKKRNKKRDEPQTPLGDWDFDGKPQPPPAPMTPADVDEGKRRLAEIPRRQWSRLAWLFITEHTSHGQMLLGRIIDAIKFTRHADAEKYMRENWVSPQSPNLKGKPGLQHWHPDAALELLKAEGFGSWSRKWYEKWRLRWGLKPVSPYLIKAPDKKV